SSEASSAIDGTPMSTSRRHSDRSKPSGSAARTASGDDALASIAPNAAWTASCSSVSARSTAPRSGPLDVRLDLLVAGGAVRLVDPALRAGVRQHPGEVAVPGVGDASGRQPPDGGDLD